MKLILLVEDDEERGAVISSWIPAGLKCIWTRSAGAALAVLRYDKFAGVLLDFDLYGKDPQGAWLTGQTVAEAISRTQSRDCKIFVHSQNPAGARTVTSFLLEAGFEVSAEPFASEKRYVFVKWLLALYLDE